MSIMRFEGLCTRGTQLHISSLTAERISTILALFKNVSCTVYLPTETLHLPLVQYLQCRLLTVVCLTSSSKMPRGKRTAVGSSTTRYKLRKKKATEYEQHKRQNKSRWPVLSIFSRHFLQKVYLSSCLLGLARCLPETVRQPTRLRKWQEPVVFANRFVNCLPL